MPRWVAPILSAIRERLANGRIRFTLKSLAELASLDQGLDESDVCQILLDLSPNEVAERLRSASTNEWMYVFKPHVGGVVLYIKVIVRTSCIVISCHDDDQATETDS